MGEQHRLNALVHLFRQPMAWLATHLDHIWLYILALSLTQLF